MCCLPLQRNALLGHVGVVVINDAGRRVSVGGFVTEDLRDVQTVYAKARHASAPDAPQIVNGDHSRWGVNVDPRIL
jgi:hypothetical protein